MTSADFRSWYKEAIVYQLHVRSFFDCDDDGMGDFRGLTAKLDYIRDLGATALWLLPFYPSPLRDDGYDISDYLSIHPSYGKLEDFREFLHAAHARGLKVITELVINHTSDQHEWFQKSRRAQPGEPYYDYYVWSENPKKFKDARIIFKDFETSNWAWDPVAKRYYWHRFYSHQPDLNFDNPQVMDEILSVMDFWLEMGVDGLRLDAIPYLIEREGTGCENLPETHRLLKRMRSHMDEKYRDRVFLAEANQWPEDAIAYFGEGDECHMAFHFPLMPRMFMALKMENHLIIEDILKQTPEIPENCQWATFLRNHDELTLEMVTDEERDYMYKVYATDPRARINLGIRRRLAPLLQNDQRQMRLLNSLLFSMIGIPIVYYGDEIGMGDNIYLGDRDGVRTPFQWNSDRNGGFSKASGQRLFLPVIIEPEYHYTTVNVETQQQNVHSMLWWMRNLIALRKQYKAFSYGKLRILPSSNPKILAYLRQTEGQTLMILANLSGKAQYVELDLKEYEGLVPHELFGYTEFPPIGQLPYLLTCGAYGFYWFELKSRELETRPEDPESPLFFSRPSLELLKESSLQGQLERKLPAYLKRQRWFSGKSRRIQSCKVADIQSIEDPGSPEWTGHFAYMTVDVQYTDGLPDTFSVPVALYFPENTEDYLKTAAVGVLSSAVLENGSPACLIDASIHPHFGRLICRLIFNEKRANGGASEVIGRLYMKDDARIERWKTEVPDQRPVNLEQSNSNLIFGRDLILKLFRRLEPGENSDLEIGRFLEAKRFAHSPRVLGALHLRKGPDIYTLGILQAYVANSGEAWNMVLERFARVAEEAAQGDAPLPQDFRDSIGLLAQRTAEMHSVLASDTVDPSFGPENFTPFYQRSLYQSLRNLCFNTLISLKRRMHSFPNHVQSLAREVLGKESEILQQFSFLKGRALEAQRIRDHGDYHLGQVLVTDGDFLILDFEGEPARSLTERKLKRSPLHDVAGMIRSLDYAYEATLKKLAEIQTEKKFDAVRSVLKVRKNELIEHFQREYFKALTAREGLVPSDPADRHKLMLAYLLDKVLYEIGYELNHRPDWVELPLRGLLDLLEAEKQSQGRGGEAAS